MQAACPVPQVGDPLVASLMGSTDCHVETLVRSGYDAIFAPSGAFASVLTVLLTIYVALIGYRLLLGRSQLNVSDFALSAVKIGVVIALATQWGNYQTVVYRTLFDGPQQAANVIVHSLGAHGVSSGGDVFGGLQRAFDDMTAFSPATPPGAAPGVPAPAAAPGIISAPPTAPTLGSATTGAGVPNLLSKAGFDSMLLLSSAIILLLSTLGVLLISKLVLALLLGLGPIFIALFLFDTTRGLFEGWLRASVAFAFAPLSTTVLLGVGLALLGPSLTEIEAMRDGNTYTPGVAFGVLVLVVVIAGVSLGLMAAAGVIAGGFKLPRFTPAARGDAATIGAAGSDRVLATQAASAPARADRVAAAASAQERRDATTFARSAAAMVVADDRRAAATAPQDRQRPDIAAPDVRLGQAPRRNAQPRTQTRQRRGLRSEA